MNTPTSDNGELGVALVRRVMRMVAILHARGQESRFLHCGMNGVVTSFVAHDVSTIVKALNDASTRGVSISMLLESSQDHGGSVSFDVIGKM